MTSLLHFAVPVTTGTGILNSLLLSCECVLNSLAQDSETSGNTVDTTDITAIARAILQGKGNKVMRKVNVRTLNVRTLNVRTLNNKSKDLKLCLSQQTNAFGFLPITNLQRLHRGHSLKPNKVLT